MMSLHTGDGYGDGDEGDEHGGGAGPLDRDVAADGYGDGDEGDGYGDGEGDFLWGAGG